MCTKLRRYLAHMLLSVVVITRNESHNIVRCLQSCMGLADELLVVDSGSTDDTVALAESCGARVLVHPFSGHIEQKNWAAAQTKARYLLSLDADEALSPELQQSLKRWRADRSASESGPAGWAVNRLTNYCGTWVRHGGWYPDRKVRLWRAGAGVWGGENPHDRFELSGGAQPALLDGDLLHYSYRNAEDHYRQIEFFSDIAATAAARRGVRSGKVMLPFRAGFQWVKNALVRGGWRDGAAGWAIARRSAWATWRKYEKLGWIGRGVDALGGRPVRRLLIVRTDGIGDVVLSLPIAEWCAVHAPEVAVDVLTRPYAAPVARACRAVHEVVEWERGTPVPLLGGYDVVVFAFPEREVVRAAVRDGVAVCVGTARRLHTWRAMTHGVWDSRKRSGEHEAWHGVQLLAPVKGLPGMARPGAALPTRGWPQQGEVAVRLHAAGPDVLPEDLRPDGRATLVLHPGSHGSANNWSIGRYVRCAQKMAREGWRVVFSGSEAEARAYRACADVPDGFFAEGGVVDAGGRLTLAELMALLATADAVVAASTGPLHLAAALGRPCLGLYGTEPPVWPERWRPVGPEADWIAVSEVASDGGLAVDVEQVVDRLRALRKTSP